MQKKTAFLKYLTALLLFGSNGVVASRIALGSAEIVLLRSVLGCLLLTALFFLTGHRLELRRNKRDLFFVAVSGVAMAADWLFLFEAYTQIGVSLGMLINYTGPAFVIALAPLVLGERITPNKVAALLLALIGGVLISGRAMVSGLSTWGLLCAVLSAFSYAVMVLANKKARHITGVQNATVQLFFTAATVVIYALIRGVHLSGAFSGGWLPILWLGFINTGVGCFCYFSSIGGLTAQTVSVCGYIEPLFAVLLAAIVLHESLSPIQILGAALILSGALMGELWGGRKHKVPSVSKPIV